MSNFKFYLFSNWLNLLVGNRCICTNFVISNYINFIYTMNYSYIYKNKNDHWNKIRYRKFIVCYINHLYLYIIIIIDCRYYPLIGIIQ